MNSMDQDIYHLQEMSLWQSVELFAEGYQSYGSKHCLCNDVAWAMNDKMPTSIILQHLSDNTRELAYHRPVPAYILTILGFHLLFKAPEWRRLSFQFLDIAAAMGDCKAARELCMIEKKCGSSTFQVSSYVRDVIADMARPGNDWHAMSFHAKHLLEAGKIDEAQAMAMQICRATTPGRASAPAETASGGPSALPWQTWLETLGLANPTEKQLAYEYGAVVWDDPEACEKHALSRDVKQGTQSWLTSATKAAMAGKTRLMHEVGLYHLALHGWYPTRRPISRAHDSKIGFAWLEMSTMFLDPDRATRIWFGLALVLREHGDRAGGMRYLEEGLKQVEGKQVSDTDEPGKQAVLKAVKALIHNWDREEIATLGEEIVASRTYLGPPVIPV